MVMELFFIHYCKIPFGCSYLPGKEKLQLYWIVYFLGFLAYINLCVWIETYLLSDTSQFLRFFIVMFSLILGIRLYQGFFYYRNITIKYEEEPEPAMVGLDYKVPLYKRRVHEG